MTDLSLQEFEKGNSTDKELNQTLTYLQQDFVRRGKGDQNN